MKELEIGKRRLDSLKKILFDYESSADERSIAGDREYGFSSSRRNVQLFTAEVSPEEAERLQSNSCRKHAVAGIRAVAHEMDDVHVGHHNTTLTSDLPKIYMNTFDGNPMGFWDFIQVPRFSGADRLFDNSNMLIHLHYCCGETKETKTLFSMASFI
ncbi:hypothetical protein CLF_113608 [Clonorchis sinensis]|uniref:Uncharacterized protein n=1 Tax=Clonorchis sinensis TaxID=79923 RepID=G7YYW1_CLOSI|nr:hypothetical protein CLF_113608 [Clonorchis sinensis]